ncbi:MAG: type IV pilus secretin PilQ [Thermodesulfobacteriota bacterium]
MNRNRNQSHFTDLLAAVAITGLLLAGCKDHYRTKPDPAFEKWRIKAETAVGHSPADTTPLMAPGHRKEPPAVKPEPAAPTREERGLPTRKISMNLSDTRVTTVLRALARAVDLNILVNEKAAGKTSIHVKDARWDELFVGILRSNGLTYAWEGDLIRVMTLEDMDRELKGAAQNRDMQLARPLLTRIVSIHYADEQKLKASLEKFLSTGKEGKSVGSIMVDEHSRSLIIQAIEEDMAQLISLIDELDNPTPQVLIEANIVEAEREVARELGVQWGGLAVNKGTVNHFLTAGSRSSGVVGGTLDKAINPTSGMIANFPATMSDGTGLAIGYVAENVGGNILMVQLSALQQEGKLNILSSPSITSMNNQTAVIEAGTNVPFQTVSKEGNINIEWKEAVLKLEVKPNVIDPETVKLLIKTNKDELNFANSVAGNPTIITKKAETSVVLMDGQTTVIGGLNKETRQNTDTGVPWFQQIPLLGYLFKSNSKSDKMEDILIFITPHILKPRPVAAAAPPVPASGESLRPADDSGNGSPDVTAERPPVVPDPGDPPSLPSPIPSNANSANAAAGPPVVIGQAAAGEGETLWDLIRMIYGTFHPSHLQAILDINPHIRSPESLRVGQLVYFPARPMAARPDGPRSCWIRIDGKKTLPEALQYLRFYPADNPPVRMLPYWSPSTGLGFDILMEEYFPDPDAAGDVLKTLPPSLAERAKIITGWEDGTIFFADPYLVIKR